MGSSHSQSRDTVPLKDAALQHCFRYIKNLGRWPAENGEIVKKMPMAAGYGLGPLKFISVLCVP
jgi:hypothetical protein